MLNLEKYKILPFAKQALVFTCVHYKSFESTVGKGEIASYEQFLLFSQCFLPFYRTFFHFSSNLKLSSAHSFSLKVKNLLFEKGFNNSELKNLV